MDSRWSSTIVLLAFSLVIGVGAVMADEQPVTPASSTTVPGGKSSIESTKQTTTTSAGNDSSTTTSSTSTSATTVTTPASSGTANSPAVNATTPPNVTTTGAAAGTAADNATSKAAAPSDPMTLLYSDNVAPGPFEAKRKLLLQSIKLAKKQGFGITSYIKELSNIEDQIKSGGNGAQLESRVDSIADGLQDQLKRSQTLKSQRPSGSGSVLHSSSSSTSVTSSDAGRPHRSTDQIINELKQKYGDRIPAGLGGMDNAELKEKLMKSDMAKEYLKRLGGGQ